MNYRSIYTYRKPYTYRGLDTQPAAVAPGLQSMMAALYDAGSAASASVASAFGDAATVCSHASAAFEDGRAVSDTVTLPLAGLPPQAAVVRAKWDAIAPRARTVAALLSDLYELNRSTHLPWRDFAGRHGSAVSAPFIAPRVFATLIHGPWGALGHWATSHAALWRALVERGAYVAVPWGPIAARQNSDAIVWPVEPDPQPGTITVPQFPVYIMLPTLTAVRLPDRTPLPLLGISIQADLDSWAWSFTAPMAVSGAALVEAGGGDPTEIEVGINGHLWTFLVDAVDDNRRFGNRTLTLRGRSRSAELAAPYAPTRTHTVGIDTLASQLASNELTDTGWTLVWDAVDWLVPGDTFGYQDLAPMDAIAQVASAVGAAVLSDPEAKQLHVLPTYPESPWGWPSVAPYAVLPASILTQGDSSWEGGTNADGIYVYAENAASGAFVKLAGSAGSNQLPMIVERLAVHADAQRELGRNALAAAGKKRRVSRTYPLFPTPAPVGQPDLGVIPLGALIEVQDTEESWRGQVMGIRIDAQRSGSALSVRQHLEIERQYR